MPSLDQLSIADNIKAQEKSPLDGQPPCDPNNPGKKKKIKHVFMKSLVETQLMWFPPPHKIQV